MGETAPFLGSVFNSALNLGNQYATQKLGLNSQPTTLVSQPAPQPVSQATGGATFGLDNQTILILAVALVAILVMK